MSEYQRFQGGDDAPIFDLTTLSPGSQRLALRSNEVETTDAYILAAKIYHRQQVAKVAIVCQAELDRFAVEQIQENPADFAACNIIRLSIANREYIEQELRESSDHKPGRCRYR